MPLPYHACPQNKLEEMHALFHFCNEGLLGDPRTFKKWVAVRYHTRHAVGIWGMTNATVCGGTLLRTGLCLLLTAVTGCRPWGKLMPVGANMFPKASGGGVGL